MARRSRPAASTPGSALRAAGSRGTAARPANLRPTGALDWSITAMLETTERLQRAGGSDRADGLTVISEAVWWVTMVDATLVRYHLDVYSDILARQRQLAGYPVGETFSRYRPVAARALRAPPA